MKKLGEYTIQIIAGVALGTIANLVCRGIGTDEFTRGLWTGSFLGLGNWIADTIIKAWNENR